jgi:hypothetical protein
LIEGGAWNRSSLTTIQTLSVGKTSNIILKKDLTVQSQYFDYALPALCLCLIASKDWNAGFAKPQQLVESMRIVEFVESTRGFCEPTGARPGLAVVESWPEY